MNRIGSVLYVIGKKTRDERVRRSKILNQKYPHSGYIELQLERVRCLKILNQKYSDAG